MSYYKVVVDDKRLEPEPDCEQSSWWEPRSPTMPRVKGSGRTVLACPTPSRKRPTNQAGTRADQRSAP
jgi:hypothetical protein